MNIIGIDNGVTGSVACLREGHQFFAPMPVKSEQSYTKAKQRVTRVDFGAFLDMLDEFNILENETMAYIERPFVNPVGFKATLSAMRALEATVIALEIYRCPYQYIDSRQWQKAMLPAGIKGTAELKRASVDIGCRLFPVWLGEIRKHRDADALLIAEWARRTRW